MVLKKTSNPEEGSGLASGEIEMEKTSACRPTSTSGFPFQSLCLSLCNGYSNGGFWIRRVIEGES